MRHGHRRLFAGAVPKQRHLHRRGQCVRHQEICSDCGFFVLSNKMCFDCFNMRTAVLAAQESTYLRLMQCCTGGPLRLCVRGGLHGSTVRHPGERVRVGAVHERRHVPRRTRRLHVPLSAGIHRCASYCIVILRCRVNCWLVYLCNRGTGFCQCV